MKWISMLVVTCALSALNGCMTCTIEGDCPKTPDSKYGRETIHGSFYGFNWDDGSRDIRVAEDGLGLAKVEYRANYLYSLISVLTLGVYAPVDVDYWVDGSVSNQCLPKKNVGSEK